MYSELTNFDLLYIKHEIIENLNLLNFELGLQIPSQIISKAKGVPYVRVARNVRQTSVSYYVKYFK